MSVELLVNASLVPASEVLSKIIEEIVETVKAAEDVLIEKESFAELSTYLDRTVPVLKELIKKNVSSSETLNKVTQTLSREVKVAKELVSECSKRNKVYLLVNCRKIVKRLQGTTKEISRALSLIPLASLDLSSSINEEIRKLCEDMLKVEFRAAVVEERVLERIETGIQERNADRSYANHLMVLIAEAVGISTDRSSLKREFDEFKKEIAEARVRKDLAEAIQMDQIIGLLERADAASSLEEKKRSYYTKKNSLGNQPLEPLQSFYCPILGDVMVDPVETSSGQTFERSAIEKWLADGNTTCPLTMTPLNSEVLRPNITLRKSIDEWKDRNTMIIIGSMKSRLLGDEPEVLQCLIQLHDLCRERDLHREWVAHENYIPLLVDFVRVKNPEIRSHALSILRLLAMDSDENKERIADVELSIESIVKSLGRKPGESKLAVALLLELSKADMVCEQIGKAQGCIFLLVTISTGENTQASSNAKELLESLSFDDQNVVQMARAKYFKPLLQRLSSGSDVSKMTMATALADMELTDHSKAILFDDGVLGPLLQLISHRDMALKQMAVKAVKNLSSLPRNGLQMIREEALAPLLSLMYSYNASSPLLREQVAATIMNLAISTTSPDAGDATVKFLESDDDFFRLFSLISLTGPDVQGSILRTFHAICQPSSAVDMRARLRQCPAVERLVQLCEHQNPTIRANAVKLFFCLTIDGDESSLAEYVEQRCLGTLLTIVKDSDDGEERTAAMGIISNLPMNNTQITQWLLDAEALPIIVKFLTDGVRNMASMSCLVENCCGALRRFTMSTNTEWQKRAAEAHVIPSLIQLLVSGTTLTKQHAAISLAQFSESSSSLSRPVQKRRGFLCCSAASEPNCPVHLGVCSVESSFCLIEANAVQPLVGLLRDKDFGVCDAALKALSTLIEGERLQNGSKVLSDAGGISAIIRLLSNCPTDLLEKVLHVLERVFRQPEYKQLYGVSAQMPLVDITQRSTGTMKRLAARLLAQLDVLRDQSNFF